MLKTEFETKEEAILYIKELTGLVVELKEVLEWSYGIVEPSPRETDFDREVKAILEKVEDFGD